MDAEAIVIGAGAIGLSIAQRLTRAGHSVILLEKEAQYGLGISSRSSEVIHAGIYYETGSLKAKLCLEGKRLLYEHCKRYNINHRNIGKIFVAVASNDVPRLVALKKQAAENGVRDLMDLDRRQLKALEPGVCAAAAVFSPSSGIFDSHSFMKSLLELGKSAGLIFAVNSEVVGAEYICSSWKVRIGGKEMATVTSKVVINAAGLHAIDLSRNIFAGRDTPTLYPAKGSYIRYSGESPVKHIIYPAIIPGLIEERVDATPDFSGSLRFGPNTENVKSLDDFSLANDLLEKMIPLIKRYLPSLDISRLQPDTSGIRPKIYGPEHKVADFSFDWAPEDGWLDLWGIESPGLTASLAIAEYCYKMLKERGYL